VLRGRKNYKKAKLAKTVRERKKIDAGETF
jgi:hypothetical protein